MQREGRVKCRPQSIDEAGEALINNPHLQEFNVSAIRLFHCIY